MCPYLLLLENPIPLSNDPKPLDFFDLKTIDAQKLPQAVNTLCATPLPATFLTRYDGLRKVRNRYTHLGHAGAHQHPIKMMHSLLDQFLELCDMTPVFSSSWSFRKSRSSAS